MIKNILYPAGVFILGLLSGAFSKFADIYTTNIGNIFSELTVWILIGTVISIYSATRKRAMLNVFLFFAGLVISYYVIADMTDSIYGWYFIRFWTSVTCVSPFLAYFVRMTQEKGVIPKFISIGITAVCIVSAVLANGIGIHDFIIVGIMIYFLFIRKPRESTDTVTGGDY